MGHLEFGIQKDTRKVLTFSRWTFPKTRAILPGKQRARGDSCQSRIPFGPNATYGTLTTRRSLSIS